MGRPFPATGVALILACPEFGEEVPHRDDRIMNFGGAGDYRTGVLAHVYVSEDEALHVSMGGLGDIPSRHTKVY